MTRVSMLDWKKMDKDSVLENGKDYMVCALDGHGSGTMSLATYYEKGYVVQVPMDRDFEVEGTEPTNEERLLAAIFGRTRPYAIPMDGLYVMTADYGVDESAENGSFEGCTQMVHCLGNRLADGEAGALPCYFAERPLFPAGVEEHPEDAAVRKADMDKEIRERQQKLLDDVQSDSVAAAVVEALGHGVQPWDEPFEYPLAGCSCSVLPQHLYAGTWYIWKSVCRMAEIGEEALQRASDDLGICNTQKEMSDRFQAFCDRYGIEPRMRRFVLYHLREMADAGPGFYTVRNNILKRGGVRSLSMPAVLLEAYGFSRLPVRIARIVKLKSIGAPEIILQNELRIAVEHYLTWKSAGRIIHVLPSFADWYGVNPDGTRGEMGSCEGKVGDPELACAYDTAHPAEEEAYEGIPEADPELQQKLTEDFEAWQDEQEEDEPEEEPRPRYECYWAPNYLMRKGTLVIWDSEAMQYVRDRDGNVEVYSACPRERLEALNGFVG